METRTCRVGIHGRNAPDFEQIDYDVIRDAKIEVVKMMSTTNVEVFRRIKEMGRDIEIITRLFDDRRGKGGQHPTPQEFAARAIPVMNSLRPYCNKFQIHNEPNHRDEIEGWGPTVEYAKDFNDWFLEVFDLLRAKCPWAELGFPGLAVPTHIHRDRAWLKHCRQAINRADWLGVHSYWQSPPGQPSQMFHRDLGLTFTYYHEQYPNKPIEILECGNSNYHTPGYPVKYEVIGQEYVEWLQRVFEHPYVRSASFFILSSHYGEIHSRWEDWWPFSWRTRDRNPRKPIVHRVGGMARPKWVDKPVAPPKKPKARPTAPPEKPEVKPAAPAEEPSAEPGKWTNQQIINAFSRVADKLGLPAKKKWSLMSRAGLSLGALAKARKEGYRGPVIDRLPRLTEEQKALLKAELAAQLKPAGVSFGPGEGPGYLWEQPELTTISLALPRAGQIRLAATRTSIEKRAARTWNRYGFLLMQVADILEIDLEVAVAVLAAETDRRGLARDGRLVIRFEPQVFYDYWGREHEEDFGRHFRFDTDRPWQKHRWRPSADEVWKACHGSLEDEWAAFEFARTLDETAAKLSTGMGLAGMMGFAYGAIGYGSVGEMFDDFASSERYQVFGVFDLIAGRRARSRRIEALRARDLAGFAALHYGSRQVARYGILLRGLLEGFERVSPIG